MRGTLTKDQAISAMENGQKVSHIYFSEDEWMKKDNHLYEFEDGCRCEVSEFWIMRDETAWGNNWYVVH